MRHGERIAMASTKSSRRIGWLPLALLCIAASGCATASNAVSETAEIKIEMVKIPAGSFRLFDSTRMPPPMRQTVSEFYIGKYEVSQEAYRSVAGELSEPFEGEGKPAAASWYQAIAFCNLLSLREGREAVYSVRGEVDPAKWGPIPAAESRNDADWDAVACDWSKNGYRLPTDMEWRWAALGGQDSPKKEFAGDPNPGESGDPSDDFAWINTIALGEGHPDYGPHPVGRKKPNEFGLYDMTGNVSEWVWDWSTSNGYHLGDETDYRGPVNPGVGTTRQSKLVRGSDWTMPKPASYAYAVADYPAIRSPGYGFRVAYYE